tara:strand:- start:1313 stop:1837 length:525 start_codon:yes stop_codon:yes gene_type:complete
MCVTAEAVDGSSFTQDGSYNNAFFEWPPKFQSFDEYKAELDEAVATHPPFGVWLSEHRNSEYITRSGRGRPMWDLSVQELKERYVKETTLRKHSKHAQRIVIKMHLEKNRNLYADEEMEFEKRQKSYALAMDAYNQARKYGQRHNSQPATPRKSMKLVERDQLVEELKLLSSEV